MNNAISVESNIELEIRVEGKKAPEIAKIDDTPITVTYDEREKNGRKLSFLFCLFVNPTSGGNKAAMYTKLEVESMKFSSFNPKGADVELLIFDLKNAESRRRGFNTVKEEQLKGQHAIRIVVCGGDGTVMWVIEEMIKANIEVQKCPIGIIPFGTGNDFSRVTGWGGEEPSTLVGRHLNGIKSLISQWTEAIIEDFDIWDIRIEVHEGGSFKFVKKDKGKKGTKQKLTTSNSDQPTTMFEKKMSNYFSIGIDARIGLGFDKSRTESRCGNKLVYCWEGFKKYFIRTPTISDVIQDVREVTVPADLPKKVEPGSINLEESKVPENRLIFGPKPKSKSKSPDSHPIRLKHDPAVLLAVNIPSYMGGGSDPWGTSRGKIGVIDKDGHKQPDFGPQNIGDGMLEFVSFPSQTALASERFIKGHARRLNQGRDIITYFQIDGEFYRVEKPKCITIRPCSLLPNGKVKVMMNSKKMK